MSRQLFKILFFSGILCLLNCGPEKADLSAVDEYIRNGQYEDAIKALNHELVKEFSDSTEYDRIHHRLFLARKGQFFNTLDNRMKSRDWESARMELNRLNQLLTSSMKDSARYFYFDFCRLKSRVDSAQQDTAQWVESLLKATEYPLADRETVKDIYGRLAEYYAGREKISRARDMMDKLMRKMSVGNLDKPFKTVFYQYMDGHFRDALKTVSAIPDSEKDRHWRRLELFLSKYHTQLNTEERFNLW